MEDKKKSHSDIIKCEYCGEYPIIKKDKYSMYQVACDCFMKTGVFYNKWKAIAAWNSQNNPVKDTKIREKENYLAKLIAAAVRNAMEDFHVKYLSDKQMEELNPIIRNAIYTALIMMLGKQMLFTKRGMIMEQMSLVILGAGDWLMPLLSMK